MIGIAEVNLLGTNFLDLFEENDREQIADILARFQTGDPEGDNTISLFFKGRHLRFEMVSAHDREANVLTIILTEDFRPQPDHQTPDTGLEEGRIQNHGSSAIPGDHEQLISDIERLLDHIDHDISDAPTIRNLAQNLRKSMDRITRGKTD